MIEPLYLTSEFLLWGAALGIIYFGGLWLTLQRLSTVNHPALLVIASFFIRNTVIAAGFYPIVLQGWKASLICLTGFILCRFIFTHQIKYRPHL